MLLDYENRFIAIRS